MTVRVYRSTDVGAPTLNNTAGSLIGVLDACLVTGYGSQLPAGWTKEYSGTNKAAYKQGALATYNQYYLRVDNTSTYSATVRGYETMTAIDSGTGMFPSYAQRTEASPLGWLYGSAVGGTWRIVADNRTVYFWAGYSRTDANYDPSAEAFLFVFGDCESSLGSADKGNCVITGTSGLSTTTYYFTSLYRFNDAIGISGMYLARTRDGISNSVPFAPVGDFRFSIMNDIQPMGVCTTALPDPSNNQLYYSHVSIVEPGDLSGVSSRLRGKLKGLITIYNGGTVYSTSAGSFRLLNHGDQIELPQFPGKTFEAFGIRSANINTSYALILIEISDTW